MIISRDLAREIDEKRRKILGNANYYARRAREIAEELRRLGDIHSYWLETPELREEILMQAGVQTPRELKEKAIQGIARVKRGWKYLDGLSPRPNGDLFYFDPRIIVKTAQQVEPYKNHQGFRKDFVKFGLEHTPPGPVVIPSLINDFCCEMKSTSYHPVERAALAHLKLAAIQPFNDGNKRTGRLFQDKVLKDYDLPPALIPYGERSTYRGVLRNGLSGVRRSNFDQLRPFVDYIGGKVNTALDEILGDLVF